MSVANIQTFLKQQGTAIPLPRNVALCAQPKADPASVSFTINWGDYGVGYSKPRLGVGIVLTNPQGQNTGLLDAIRSAKIDNSYNPVPVFLVFSDTGDTLSCPPYAIVQSPVMTNGFEATLYGDGFFDGRPPQTTIEFFNRVLDANVVPGDIVSKVTPHFLSSNRQAAGAGTASLTFPAVPALPTTPAIPSRLIACCWGGVGDVAGARTLNSGTINGIPLNIDAGAQFSGQPTGGAFGIYLGGIAYALVPTGNTFTVVLNFSGNIKIGWSSLWGIDGYTNIVPTVDGGAASGTGIDASVGGLAQIDAIPGAAAVFMGLNFTAGATPIIWENADKMSIQYDGTSQTAFSIARRDFVENGSEGCGQQKGVIIAGGTWI